MQERNHDAVPEIVGKCCVTVSDPLLPLLALERESNGHRGDCEGGRMERPPRKPPVFAPALTVPRHSKGQSYNVFYKTCGYTHRGMFTKLHYLLTQQTAFAVRLH